MISNKYFKLNYDIDTNSLSMDTNCFDFDKSISNNVENFPENNKCIYYIYDQDWSNPVPYRYVSGGVVYLRQTKGTATKNITAIANIGGKCYCTMVVFNEFPLDVESIAPLHQSVDNPLSSKVTVKFNKNVNENTIDENSLYIWLDEEVPSNSIFLQDIYEIRNNLSSNITMDQSLDFNDDNSYDQTDPDWQAKKLAWTTGEGFPPIEIDYGSGVDSFTGIFDGAGFTISNLYQNSYYKVGLFGHNYGTIKNLRVTGDVTIEAGEGGMLCIYNGGIIEKCSVGGAININNPIEDNWMYIGGLCSSALSASSIEDSYSRVNMLSIRPVFGYFGGLVATVESGATINNCYAANTFPVMTTEPDSSYVGGLVGAEFVLS